MSERKPCPICLSVWHRVDCPDYDGCTGHTGECGCVCKICGRIGGQLCRGDEDCKHLNALLAPEEL